jgi:hypothetical protein
MPNHQPDSSNGGLRLPLRITADGRVALMWPEPRLHSLVFGFNLVGLARIALARLSDQDMPELLTGYSLVLPIALSLAALAKKRMRERAPRLYASALSLVALALYTLPGTLPTITPTTLSNQVALVTMLTLASGSLTAEILHRISDRADLERLDDG